MNCFYGKWGSPEETEVAFLKVKSGEWTLERFEAWKSQVKIEQHRDSTTVVFNRMFQRYTCFYETVYSSL